MGNSFKIPLVLRPLIGLLFSIIGIIILTIATGFLVLIIAAIAAFLITLPITALFINQAKWDGKKMVFTRGK